MIIAVLDDHRLFADSLASMLENTSRFKKVKVYYDTDNLETNKLDVLLMDISIGSENGLLFYEKNKKALFPDTKVIVLSSIENISTIEFALKIGANGYLSKNCELVELIEAIECVQKGEIYLTAEIKDALLRKSYTPHNKFPQLTKRESEILDYLCASFTVKEIAGDLEISTHTVQMYIKNLMKKFKINRTTDLVIYALQQKLNNPITKGNFPEK